MGSSAWQRYKETISFKSDLKEVFFRSHARYATLDGVRAITVLMMVMFHVLFGVVVILEHDIGKLDGFITGFPRYLGWLWQSQGSDPLFLLCGLLVSNTLYREMDRTGTIAVGTFYIRRLMRIMPLFLLALLIYLPAHRDNLGHLWSNIIFMSNYIPLESHIIPVGWSLDVQMHFYFLLPFMVFLLWKTSHRLLLLSIMCVASIAWRYYVVARDPQIFETPFYQIIYNNDFGSLLANKLYYDIDVRIGAFLMGMLVAYLHRYYAAGIQRFFQQRPVFNAALAISAVGMIVFALHFPVENRYAPFYDDFSPQFNLWFLAFDRYLYCVGLSILIIQALCPAGISVLLERALSLKLWHPVAQLIFPIYLFHFPFIVIAAAITFGTFDRHAISVISTLQVFSIFFWTVALTMLFSAVAHVLLEKPFLKMRDSATGEARVDAEARGLLQVMTFVLILTLFFYAYQYQVSQRDLARNPVAALKLIREDMADPPLIYSLSGTAVFPLPGDLVDSPQRAGEFLAQAQSYADTHEAMLQAEDKLAGLREQLEQVEASPEQAGAVRKKIKRLKKRLHDLTSRYSSHPLNSPDEASPWVLAAFYSMLALLAFVLNLLIYRGWEGLRKLPVFARGN